MLVPRKMSISPLESWLTAHYLLPRPGAGAPGTVAPAQLYECPPSQAGEGAKQGDEGTQGAPSMQCKNVLKIRRRKMNHHKYRKLVKRTRFLRRKVREGRLKRKQVRAGPEPGGPSGLVQGWAANQPRSRPLPAGQVRERPKAHLAEGGPEGSPRGLADPEDLPEGKMTVEGLQPGPLPLSVVINARRAAPSLARRELPWGPACRSGSLTSTTVCWGNSGEQRRGTASGVRPSHWRRQPLGGHLGGTSALGVALGVGSAQAEVCDGVVGGRHWGDGEGRQKRPRHPQR